MRSWRNIGDSCLVGESWISGRGVLHQMRQLVWKGIAKRGYGEYNAADLMPL